MILEKTKFDFDDVTIIPEIISSIRYRSEVNPFMSLDNGEKYLPLMTAPMDTVINTNNSEIFKKNNILISYPRNVKGSFLSENSFISISLDQAKEMSQLSSNDKGYYIIDIANGHMEELYEITKKIVELRPNIQLIVGNIANPRTYKLFAELGIYGCRIGVGGGGACFIGGTKIAVNGGEIEIENITVNHKVLTHNLNYKEVLSTHIQECSELIQINDTISTNSHEYYVIHSTFITDLDDENIHKYAKFIKAEDLTSDYLIIGGGN